MKWVIVARVKRVRLLLSFGLAGLSSAGCGGARIPDSGAFRVVLLGDGTRIEALSELSRGAPDGVRFSTPPELGGVLDAADEARAADFALIVTDATQGPTPIVREHILLARQLRIPTVGLFLSNTDEVLAIMGGDRELLDLVELELRELMLTYELAGDTAPRFYSSDALDASSGPTALADALESGRFPLRGAQAPPAMTGAILDTEIYLLSKLEASAVTAISSGSSVSVWIDGERIAGEADVATAIQPGEATALRVRLASSVTSYQGARFFVEREGQLVAVGVVLDLE